MVVFFEKQLNPIKYCQPVFILWIIISEKRKDIVRYTLF